MSCRKEGETTVAIFKFGVIKERSRAGREEGINAA
jgi:hypothetical protein